MFLDIFGYIAGYLLCIFYNYPLQDLLPRFSRRFLGLGWGDFHPILHTWVRKSTLLLDIADKEYYFFHEICNTVADPSVPDRFKIQILSRKHINTTHWYPLLTDLGLDYCYLGWQGNATWWQYFNRLLHSAHQKITVLQGQMSVLLVFNIWTPLASGQVLKILILKATFLLRLVNSFMSYDTSKNNLSRCPDIKKLMINHWSTITLSKRWHFL